MELAEEVVWCLITVLRVLLVIIIDSVKALLPIGILPRKNVTGEVVLITGAGSGLGRLMAIEFAKVGAQLVLWDINTKSNEETRDILRKMGSEARTYTVDLSKKEEIYEAADKVMSEIGNIDILVNNAGIVTGRKLYECPDELMEKTVAVNTNALFFTTKKFVKGMIEQNHGHLVTIASMAGKTGTPGLVDYCASKHGAVGFHESMAAELRRIGADGVKTTMVCPFYINTGMFAGATTAAPNLIPILEPEYVVEAIMEAILTNKVEIQLPRFTYMATFMAKYVWWNHALTAHYYDYELSKTTLTDIYDTTIVESHENHMNCTLLPTEAKMILYEYFGIFESMDHFTGRK